mmetsp:Transcript_24657/g.62427  ORF Transcript_24657/g.62427 Transcript_24657/m.62427 type:complete len:231 (+) Transcript_24657:334-1026(+)
MSGDWSTRCSPSMSSGRTHAQLTPTTPPRGISACVAASTATVPPCEKPRMNSSCSRQLHFCTSARSRALSASEEQRRPSQRRWSPAFMGSDISEPSCSKARYQPEPMSSKGSLIGAVTDRTDVWGSFSLRPNAAKFAAVSPKPWRRTSKLLSTPSALRSNTNGPSDGASSLASGQVRSYRVRERKHVSFTSRPLALLSRTRTATRAHSWKGASFSTSTCAPLSAVEDVRP